MFYTNQTNNLGGRSTVVVGLEGQTVSMRCFFSGRSDTFYWYYSWNVLHLYSLCENRFSSFILFYYYLFMTTKDNRTWQVASKATADRWQWSAPWRNTTVFVPETSCYISSTPCRSRCQCEKRRALNMLLIGDCIFVFFAWRIKAIWESHSCKIMFYGEPPPPKKNLNLRGENRF